MNVYKIVLLYKNRPEYVSGEVRGNDLFDEDVLFAGDRVLFNDTTGACVVTIREA